MGVCRINATVVCVNVLQFGPITADMLDRGRDCQPGGNCKIKKHSEPVGLVMVTSGGKGPNSLRFYFKSDRWDSTGGCVCR